MWEFFTHGEFTALKGVEKREERQRSKAAYQVCKKLFDFRLFAKVFCRQINFLFI
jgi:hypothetical protein